MAEYNAKETALFMQLVITFQTAAWQQLGKIKNPLTDKVERSLDQARYSIDMLDMLRSRTKGNLSEDEAKFLNQVIGELQLNYVDEQRKDEKARSEAKAEAKPEAKAEAKAEGREPHARDGVKNQEGQGAGAGDKP